MRVASIGVVVFASILAGCSAPCPTAADADDQIHAVPTSRSQHSDLENVFQVTKKLYSGSVPDGDEAFDELRAMGIRTIISVDGAAPDVERARARGLRYVHLPIGYHGIEPERRMTLARAVRDLPGPIYLHCHHGKHRGPAAAAAAAVVLGFLTPAEGLSVLKEAGTSPHYTGLYACVVEAEPAPSDMLESVAPEFPEIAPMPGFVKAMVEAQEAYDHLVEVRDARWTVPVANPDIVPLAEAGRLENLLRALREDPEARRYPAGFSDMMRASHVATMSFERALGGELPPATLTERLRVVGSSCRTCHERYRDSR